jgi:hypothetical protein
VSAFERIVVGVDGRSGGREALLRRRCRWRSRAVPARSVEEGLLAAADAERAVAIVVGSSRRGPGYREAGGDPGDDALLALMACYRALVRAKIDAMRGRAERAQQRIAQATALRWRARGPMLLAVCGPPATGKSTLAAALCEQSPMVRVSSDVIRKAPLWRPPGEHQTARTTTSPRCTPTARLASRPPRRWPPAAAP